MTQENLQNNPNQQQSSIDPITTTPTKIYGENSYMTQHTVKFAEEEYESEKFGDVSLDDIKSLLNHKPFTKGENRRVQYYEGVLFLERRDVPRDSALKALAAIFKTTKNTAMRHFKSHVAFLKMSPEAKLVAALKKPGRKSLINNSVIERLKLALKRKYERGEIVQLDFIRNFIERKTGKLILRDTLKRILVAMESFQKSKTY